MEECPMTFTNTYITKLAGAFFARSKVLLATAGILLLSILVACAPPEDGDGGTDDTTYTVGGTVIGHSGEVSLALTYGNETDTLKVAKGTEKFTFAAKLVADQSFTIEITAPAGQTCRSSRTQGTIVNANITDIVVTCSDDAAGTYSVGGSVTGLANGDTITLTLTPTGGSTETEDVTADGTFAFDTKLAKDATYTVTTTSPAGKTCTVNNAGQQTMGEGDVSDISVTCVANTYSVGGSVTGLANGETITLTLSPTGGSTETEDVTADGTFAFDTKLAKDATYTVTTTSPAGKTCTVNNAGQQTMGEGDVSDISVTCVAIPAYSVGGTVSGLANGETITLTLSPTGGSTETEDVTADGTFAFDTELTKDTTYTVTTTSPVGRTCTVAPTGRQTMGTADITNIAVTCIAATVSISGTVTDADENAFVYIVLTLYDDNTGTGGTSQTTSPNAAGAFSFTGVPANKYYTLQVSSRTASETCSGPSLTITPTQVTADVTGAQITCSISAGPFIRIQVVNYAFEGSLTTVNVFIGDNAIPATTGTPTKVINGSDSDVVVIDYGFGNDADGFFYDVAIDTNKYYAITATSATVNCRVGNGATGGPVATSVTVGITCE